LSDVVRTKVQRSRDGKRGQFQKSDQLNFNRDHLPAPIINGEEIALENGRISDFHGLVTLTLTWHAHYLFCISHRVLHVYQISSKLKKLFVDGRMYGRKFYTHIIRSTSKFWKSN